jgi:hypothetical protein
MTGAPTSGASTNVAWGRSMRADRGVHGFEGAVHVRPSGPVHGLHGGTVLEHAGAAT